MRPNDLPRWTSASQLATYAACPRRYELKYVLGMVPERRSTAVALGSAVHGAIEWWFEQRVADAEPELHDALRIARADLEAGLAAEDVEWRDATRDSLATQAAGLVRLFLEQYGELDVRAVEVPFELPIIDPSTGRQMPRTLVGYFDLVLTNGNVVEIKTVRAAYSPVALRVGLQFAAYRTAARYEGGDIEVIALVKTKSPRVQHVVLPHDGDVSRWFMLTAARIERAILAGHFPPSPGPMCANCEYRGTCLGLSTELTEEHDAEAA